MNKIILIFFLATFAFSSCKSKKTYITKENIQKDSTIIKEEKSITLPQKSIIIFPNVFKGLNLKLKTQVIKNESTEFKVQKKGDDLNIEFSSDSIISTNKTTDNIKIQIERIEVPVEVEVPVKNKLNWYFVLYGSVATIALFRKQIWWLVKKFIFPLFI